MIRDSKAGHPVADKSVGDGLYVGAVQREGNQLVRRAVHYCEEVVGRWPTRSRWIGENRLARMGIF